MEHNDKSNAFKEGWNANCQGQNILSGQTYSIGTPESIDWLNGFNEAERERAKRTPSLLTIKYKNPLTKKDGWRKLKYT